MIIETEMRKEARDAEKAGNIEQAIEIDTAAHIQEWEKNVGRPCSEDLKEELAKESRKYFGG